MLQVVIFCYLYSCATCDRVV